MAASNTYRGSIRDGTKYLTLNGIEEEYLRPCWGWYGHATETTAMRILRIEYGPKTALHHYVRFSREYLATYPEEGFTLTSGQIAFIINQLEKT
jgi:hypothetical protein